MPRRNTPHRALSAHLTLHAWLNSHFQYKSTRHLLNAVKDIDEGFNANGRSAVCELLMTCAVPDSIVEQALPTYDANIKRHLSAINDTRSEPIVLRYFQYLALLYTEIFLDWKFNRPEQLLHQLNVFVQQRNEARAPGDPTDTEFAAVDLEKLAFWMATGAGKTLIMHINYHQFLHYCREKLDHVVLITPNEGLSEQHLRELANSDIRGERFKAEGGRFSNNRDTLQVIEITKLVEEKTGEGESVEVEAFEGNNLIFVDEGHKGSGGEVWRDIRDKLGKTGFTFEYSATFGQALAAAKNPALVDEYGKAIAFDYSYRYFYEDGYGKNFRILNVKHDEGTQTELLLLANLLTFYEQRRYFKENTEAVRTYELDAPLWAFVGSRVSGNVVYTEGGRSRSDVLNVIRFLHRFLKNHENWTIRNIERILNGNSGLSDETGTDIFHARLNYLKTFSETAEHIYRGILKEVFHTNHSGTLHLQDVQNARGEIALKTTHGTHKFGLIYIGDTAAFKKLVDTDAAGVIIESEDALTESLFADINAPDSPINILIGAKKFIEGWDSWRVTTMGLLNIGRQEGSQIIQLFGRGVRLRGRHRSLKRSTALDGKHPPHISLLETLNIFAVRANFMTQFRDYLLREGVSYEEPVQLTIQIRRKDDYIDKGLFLPKALPYHEGAKGRCEPLKVLKDTIITHTTQRVDIVGSSSQRGIHTERAEGSIPRCIPEPSLALVDWEKIYLKLIAYKHERGYHNLIFDITILREILNPNDPVYQLTVTDESEVLPKSVVELGRLEELVLTLLRKYIDKYYSIIQKRWNDERIRLHHLGKTPEDENNFPDWIVHVPRSEAQEVDSKIKGLVENEGMYGDELTDLPNVYSEKHLYQPLLTNEEHLYRSLLNPGMGNNLWRTTPPALEDSERDFIEDLNRYLYRYNQKTPQKEIYLLRNQSRGKGVGFYENEGFYPDFILWILQGVKQRIVFIEPHGMVHEAINQHNSKLTLFKRLRNLSYERFRGEHVQMDSFVISRTDFQVLRRREGIDKKEFAEKWHILFRNPADPIYLSPIFQDSDSAAV